MSNFIVIPHLVKGSCRKAGYETCCFEAINEPNACRGAPLSAPECYCDQRCERLEDCCEDYYEICGGEYTRHVA